MSDPKAAKEQKEQNTKALLMKLGQRMDPYEADQRAFINKDELFSPMVRTVHFIHILAL